MMSDRKKDRRSQRRSSFMPNRLKLQLSESKVEDLHKVIDTSKPPDERFAQLTRSCLDHALDRMGEEFTDIKDYQSLRKDLRDAAIRCIEEMEMEGLFRESVSQPEKVCNPYNLDIEAAIADAGEYTEKLKKEMQRWDALLEESEEKITALQRVSDQSFQGSDLTEDEKTLSTQYLPDDRLDFRRIIDDVTQEKVRFNLHMDDYQGTVDMIQRVYRICDRFIKKEEEKLVKADNGDMENQESPRRLIEALVADN